MESNPREKLLTLIGKAADSAFSAGASEACDGLIELFTNLPNYTYPMRRGEIVMIITRAKEKMAESDGALTEFIKDEVRRLMNKGEKND